jgi:3D-(3,5/4)-trihydroxycyclohexane-1,2-dione acylhydrolase (decyclizing)
MVATSSIGPGALNMVTAAGTAHANRLPVLLIAGDTFTNRLPDPVLQQVEHFGNPTITVNDAFKAVTRYWDRITHPAQIISSLPQAVGAMLDPADCGPAFIALPQDTRNWPSTIRPSSLKTAPHGPSPARARPQARGRGRRAAEDRQAAADHRRRRRALFGAEEAQSRFAAEARHSGGGDHRRQGRPDA